MKNLFLFAPREAIGLANVHLCEVVPTKLQLNSGSSSAWSHHCCAYKGPALLVVSFSTNITCLVDGGSLSELHLYCAVICPAFICGAVQRSVVALVVIVGLFSAPQFALVTCECTWRQRFETKLELCMVVYYLFCQLLWCTQVYIMSVYTKRNRC